MRRPRKRRLNKGFIFLLFILFIGLLIFGSYSYYNKALSPVSKANEEVTFIVNNGESPKKVISNLKKEGLIKDENITLLYIKLNKLTNIKAGEYVLNKTWSVKEIFEYINGSTNAKSDDIKVTIIEGDWAKDIARKIASATSISEEDLLNLWNNKDYIKGLMAEYPFLTDDIFNENSRIYLEGYLYPNTYLFFKDTDADKVTRKMLNETLKVYNEYKDQINNNSLSIHELFTLASIVQYEAGKVEDMKLIAGVFFNRLNINMKLQSSVTVCYAIDKEKEDDWTACEVNPNYDSPYNTYKYGGLPPGPILNPSKNALEAILNPTSSDYLYFMADVYGDGTVYYSKTYEEHQAYVRKYLR